jgi:septal ring factor EnvC (AmiA/AmiB activator)
MQRVAFLLTLVVVLAGPACAYGQVSKEREDTKKRLNQLREQITEGEERLAKIRKREKASLRKLENLDRKITVRKELISNYRTRRRQLSAKLDSIQQSSAQLERRVDELRSEYKKRAVHAYRHGRLHDLALILSARSINQMLVRVRYLHRFAEQREGQLSELHTATRDLEQRRQRLRRTQGKLDSLIAETQAQRQNLTDLQEDRQQVVSSLRAQEETLKPKLEKKRKSASELEKRMRELVAAERKRAAGDAASRERFKELSGSFEQNKGRLPWPAPGVITEPYGEVTNPVYGTKTPNPGVLISTKVSAPVQAVFEGRVFRVFTMPNFGTCAALSHGSYSSIYCNLSLTYVSKGQQIDAGTTVGRAGTESAPKGSGVFFGLYDQEQSINPTAWLSKQ